MVDLDYENAFPSLEWDPVDAAVWEEVEPLANWTEWRHSGPVPVYLPSGAVVWSDRGAEQGDPHGSVQCALTLAGVASRTRAGIIEASRAHGRRPCRQRRWRFCSPRGTWAPPRAWILRCLVC